MLGQTHLDLARTLADEHLSGGYDHRTKARREFAAVRTARQWLGIRLIHIGERLVPRPTELRLKVSTGPPCP